MRVNERFILISVTSLLLIFSIGVSAETFEPNPGLSIKDAWNKLFDNKDNFGNTRVIIRSVFGVVLLYFTAWCAFGLYAAYFVSKSIKQHEFIIYIFRLLVILLVGMWLFNLGK